MQTVKLPEGKSVYGFSGIRYRGEIPISDCPDHVADKYAGLQTPADKPDKPGSAKKSVEAG